MIADAASISDLVERRARDDRDRPVCFFEDTAVTFGALERAMNRVANALAGAGIGAGERVAVMLPNHLEHLYTILALARLGATHVPVNVHLREAGLRDQLDHAEVRVVIGDTRYAAELAPAIARQPRVEVAVWRGPSTPAARGGVSFETLVAGARDTAPRAVPLDDQVISIMYTSGTTGAPKGVMLTNRMYRVAGRTAGALADVRPGDVLFLWEPFYHFAGVQTLAACLEYGVACALVERFSASAFWDQTRRYGATQIHYLGGVVSLLLKQPERRDDADNPVRIAWGAAAPVQVWPVFERRFGVTIRECYGLTEGSSFTTLNLEGKLGSCGRPVDHFEVRIVDDEDRPLGPGQLGEIAQRGREPGLVMQGYFRNPEATATALRGGWLHTGDLGSYDEEGLFYFKGRKKDSLRRRGENVSAWEVERVVNACPGVEECAVIAVPSEVGEDDIKVFIKPASGQRPDPLDVIRWCERHLAYFQVPRYVEFIDEFPKTPTERIRKEELSRSVDGCWDLEKSGYQLERAR